MPRLDGAHRVSLEHLRTPIHYERGMVGQNLHPRCRALPCAPSPGSHERPVNPFDGGYHCSATEGTLAANGPILDRSATTARRCPTGV